jgi:hypothetical protein
MFRCRFRTDFCELIFLVESMAAQIPGFAEEVPYLAKDPEYCDALASVVSLIRRELNPNIDPRRTRSSTQHILGPAAMISNHCAMKLSIIWNQLPRSSPPSRLGMPNQGLEGTTMK